MYERAVDIGSSCSRARSHRWRPRAMRGCASKRPRARRRPRSRTTSSLRRARRRAPRQALSRQAPWMALIVFCAPAGGLRAAQLRFDAHGHRVRGDRLELRHPLQYESLADADRDAGADRAQLVQKPIRRAAASMNRAFARQRREQSQTGARLSRGPSRYPSRANIPISAARAPRTGPTFVRSASSPSARPRSASENGTSVESASFELARSQLPSVSDGRSSARG